MEVKMPYVKRMGLGGIMLEVIMVGCFWLLLADFKIGMVMGTIVTASVIMMSVIDQVIYHKYKIPITKEIVEREHQIILYGSASTRWSQCVSDKATYSSAVSSRFP